MRRHRRPDDQAAERLLDTAATAGRPTVPVARLLAAAAAPARPGELSGEDEALAAFRAARAHPPTPVSASRPVRRTAPAVAWLAGLAVVATAGVAVAAVELRDADPPPAPPTPTVSRTAAPSPSGSAPASTPSRPTPGASTTTALDPTPHRSGSADGPGSAGLRGRCVAYLAQPRSHRREMLTNPAYQALVAAAGGPDQVEAYCRDRVDSRPGGHGGPPADHPSRPR